MNEEKSLIEQKRSKGPFQWLKAQFEKIKQIFRGTNNKETAQQEGELTVEQLDNITAGYPIATRTVDKEELMADLGVTEPKSWDLSEEQLDEVKAGYTNEKQEEGELTVEQLDDITAGQPTIDDDESR